jgi:acetamidase/formamidase
MPKDFAKGFLRLREARRRKFSDKIEVPLHPLFGSMGVAPPRSAGRISGRRVFTPVTWITKDLVAGITQFLPVHVAGALFEVGDGHAGQGNGEVDITAMETSLVATFQFVVRKDMHLKWP